MTTRGKLTQLNVQFIEALTQDFEQHGVAALERVRVESPQKYAQLAADLIPRTIILDEPNQFDKVQTAEELKVIIFEQIIALGWVNDLLAAAAEAAKPIAIEASNGAG